MLTFDDARRNEDSLQMDEGGSPSRSSQRAAALLNGWRVARETLRNFRRTRPFWGGFWLIVGGWVILRLSMVSISAAIGTGVTGFGGWLTGAGCILCGLLIWAVPTQRYVAGLIGLVLAVSSLVLSNLGGLVIGMLLAIVGGAMALSWGLKKPRAGDSGDSGGGEERLAAEAETAGVRV